MFLIFDIGNTNQKLAVFDEDSEMVDFFQSQKLEKSLVTNILGQYDIQYAMISSVGKQDDDLLMWLSKRVSVLTFSAALHLPIGVQYLTSDTLGSDRLANAIGANALFPDRNVLAIQLGTCLVCDFVNAENQYVGGSIAPGLRMRFEALHQHTAHLPNITPRNIDFIVGKTTEESILSGVINGMAAEIDGIVSRYETLYENLQVVVTGGDLDFLKSFIKNRIFAAPNLVLWGMYKTLRLNVSKNK